MVLLLTVCGCILSWLSPPEHTSSLADPFACYTFLPDNDIAPFLISYQTAQCYFLSEVFLDKAI